MDDVNAYIESGILELYVLGDLSPAEREQVERMAKQHPTVKAELEKVAHALEHYAAEHAVTPPSKARTLVLNSLVTNLGDDRIFTKGRFGNGEKIIEEPPTQNTSIYKYAFAACLALLILSIIALASVYNKLQQSNVQLLTLQTQNQRYSSRVSLLNNEIQVFRDPSFKVIQLQGTVKTPSCRLVVVWNPSKKKVMIDMANMHLPATDAQHQYQLWAIVNSKPVDLGVFDAKSDTTDMKLMKPVDGAEAFAVTIEPKGGSAFPTLDQMIVQGKI